MESPVKRAGQEERLVDYHELVVHVSSLVIITAHGNAVIRQGLAIIAFVLHALIVGDDTNGDASVMSVFYSCREHIVGEVKDTDAERKKHRFGIWLSTHLYLNLCLCFNLYTFN